ncbi:histidine phosphatase superfamily [Russula earlei]|uniref:Histidine phosphatase superfamily n=1 Tax=Russula earlei TaxID=71964 RepID=A0ACC0TUX6_9AGAM|nr:histidine phosphatase superfamily [Russula earlei]
MRTSVVAISCLAIGITLSFALPSGDGITDWKSLPYSKKNLTVRKQKELDKISQKLANHNYAQWALAQGLIPGSDEMRRLRDAHYIETQPLEQELKKFNRKTPVQESVDGVDFVHKSQTHCTSMGTVRIYSTWHGETEENKQGIIQGQLDMALNAEGEKQADLVAKALKDVPFDACYFSDLRLYHDGVGLQTQTALRGRHMGHFQGRLYEDFKAKRLVQKEGEGSQKPKSSESSESVTRRAVTWWNETIVGTTASHVLVVSHSAWISRLVEGLLEQESIRAASGVMVSRGRHDNAGVSIIEMPRERGRGNLLQFGSVMDLRENVETDAV